MSEDPVGEGPVGEGPDEDGELALERRTAKSEAAFRTISEVADDLEVPQHVLRFWESKFPQIRPLKRGGGRRYYRPEDVALLKRIRDLLYAEGYTIKGVQKLLREGAARPAAKASRPRAAEPTLPIGRPDDDIMFPEGEAAEPEPPPPPAARAIPRAADLPPEARVELQAILDELEHLRGLLQPRD